MSTNYGVTPAGFYSKPVTQIQTEITNDLLALVDPALDTSSAEAIGQISGVVAEKAGEVWELAQFAYGSINRDDSEGNQLDNVGGLTGSLRLAPKPSLVLCNVTLSATNSPYAQGTLIAAVAGQPNVQFSNAGTVIVTSSGVQTGIAFTSIEDGPIPCGAGALTVISTPVTGWTAVTNPNGAVLGNVEEADADYRLRQEEEIAAAGSGTVDSIEADTLEVDGGAVLSINVLENNTGAFDANGTPPYCIQAIVWDGIVAQASNNDIAQALWDDKPAGATYVGSTTGTATDSQGNSRTVPFTRPTQELVYLSYTVTFTAGLSSAAQTAAITAIKNAAAAFSLNNDAVLQPGIPVVALALKAAALGVQGIFDVPTLALGFSPSPVGTVNLSIGALQVGVILQTNILVNGV